MDCMHQAETTTQAWMCATYLILPHQHQTCISVWAPDQDYVHWIIIFPVSVLCQSLSGIIFPLTILVGWLKESCLTSSHITGQSWNDIITYDWLLLKCQKVNVPKLILYYLLKFSLRDLQTRYQQVCLYMDVLKTFHCCLPAFVKILQSWYIIM